MSFYRFARALLLFLCRLLWRVQVVGREHVPTDGVYIVAPSHRSGLDIPFAATVTRRRLRFMAKQEIFSTRLGRKVFTALGAIKVDRGSTDRGALRASQAALQEGEPLVIFPEGTRREGRAIVDLFDGCAYLSTKLSVPLVPVGIGGSGDILPRGRRWPRFPKVVVVVGAPVVPPEPPADGSRVQRRSQVRALTEELRVALQECYDDALERSGATDPDSAAGDLALREDREHA
ncbi:MAG: lysophospholipid acyltransferase family protein [Acidimicrobiia bacterium]